jgi:hypothetical protein
MSQRQSGIGDVTHPFACCEDNLMLSLLRIITVLSGLGLFLIGVIWWLQPATAAEVLGASLLDGTGRSTQIGDSGAFFIGAGGLLALGAIRNHAALVISGVCWSAWSFPVAFYPLQPMAAPGRLMKLLANALS